MPLHHTADTRQNLHTLLQFLIEICSTTISCSRTMIVNSWCDRFNCSSMPCAACRSRHFICTCGQAGMHAASCLLGDTVQAATDVSVDLRACRLLHAKIIGSYKSLFGSSLFFPETTQYKMCYWACAVVNMHTLLKHNSGPLLNGTSHIS